LLETGTILAGYRIDALLGKGGMGAVYVATQLSLNRTVALKVLASHLSEDATFRERFRREGLVQAALDHPHIVPIHEAGETDHGLFLAMRLIRGRDLKARIVAGEIDAERTLRVLEPVARAIDAAHQAGLVHRDIKPQNVLVGADDHAYLADFGLGRVGGDAGLTRTGELVGTLDYVAPEQVTGKPATGSSDIYAFAAVLYECLTGAVPYPRDSDAAILYAHVSDPAPVVSAQRPELPAALNAVIARAMAKKPSKRHPSAAALMQEAEAALLEAGPIGAPAGARRVGAATTTAHAVPGLAPLAEADPPAGRACPSCGQTSATDGRFCPHCGAELEPETGAFPGFGSDDFTCLADPFRRPERAGRLEERVRALWAALAEELPEDDARELAGVEVDGLEPGDDWLRSAPERPPGQLGLALAMTDRELQLCVEGRDRHQSEAFLAWLSDDQHAEALDELSGYRLVVWRPGRAQHGAERTPFATSGRPRVFDREAALVDGAARAELLGLMTGMEQLTGMSDLWWRPPFALGTTLAAEEAVRLGAELVAEVATELHRLLALARDMEAAGARVALAAS